MIYFVSHWAQAPPNIAEAVLIAVYLYLGNWFKDKA